MSSSRRTVRGAVGLLAVGACLAGRAYWLNSQQHDLQAALTAPVPSALTEETLPPVPFPAPPTTGSPAVTAPTRTSATPVARPRTHPAPVVKPIIPTQVFIPKLGVNTTVTPGPTKFAWDEFLGKQVPSFSVPPDTAKGMLTTTWWSSGPRPGAPGLAIILGHTQIGGPGVFNDLARLQTGDVAGVSNGTIVLKFQVIGSPMTGIPKTDATALQRVLIHAPPASRLAFITCSGHFNGHESVENTVVFMRLVAVGTAGK